MFTMEKGFYVATAAVLLWGVMDAVSRLVVSSLEMNPLLFTFFNFFYGAAVLWILAGNGKEGMASLKSWYTWLYGFLRVVHLALFNIALLMITATEAAFITRISAVVGVGLVYLAFSRKPNPRDLPGLALLTAGVVAMIATQDGGFANWGVWFVLGVAFLNALLLVIVEAHPVAKESTSHRARSRYTAVTLLVSSGFFLLVSLGLAWLGSQGIHTGIFVTPTLADFFAWQTHVVSLLVGGLIIGPVMYLTFWAVRLLKSDNMLLAGSMIPFSTIAFESLFGVMGLVDTANISGFDVLLGLIITLGSVYTVIRRLLADAVKELPHDWVEDELAELDKQEAARKARGEKVTKIR